MANESAAHPRQPREPATTPSPLRAALLLLALTGAALVLLGILTMLQRHGRFSVGVGGMLVLYGLGVIGLAWLGQRRHPLAFGAMTAATVLHALVVVSTARGSGVWWLWLVLVPVLVTLVCLMWPSSRRELGHYTLPPED